MSDQNTQERTLPETSSPLEGKPQRRSRRSVVSLLLLLGGVIIIGVVVIVAWQVLSQHAASTGANAAGTSTSSRKGDNNSTTPHGWNDPALYWQTIRAQVAQGLHLSVAQITVKLHAAGATSTVTPSANNKGNSPDPGAPMTAVAAQQGITTDQLRAIELNALQKACDVMVAQGRLTQTVADQRMQMFRGWDQGTMNWYVMHAFTGQ
jgi:flagellar basal body-associated protein FliL